MTLHKMLQLVIHFFLNFGCKECKSAPAFLWMQTLADSELAWAEFPVDVIDWATTLGRADADVVFGKQMWLHFDPHQTSWILWSGSYKTAVNMIAILNMVFSSSLVLCWWGCLASWQLRTQAKGVEFKIKNIRGMFRHHWSRGFVDSCLRSHWQKAKNEWKHAVSMCVF